MRPATAAKGSAQRGSRAPWAKRMRARLMRPSCRRRRSSIAHQPAERRQRQTEVERARRGGDEPGRPVAEQAEMAEDVVEQDEADAEHDAHEDLEAEAARARAEDRKSVV